jgi:lambda family phage minor tail protein L
MTANASLQRRQQSLTPGVEVELFELDLTTIPQLDGAGFGSLYRFCSSYRESTRTVVFNGNTYTPIAIMAEGFEVSGKGRLPNPKLVMSNTDLLVTTILTSLGDILGAKVTRFLTFDRYLDDGEEPDGEATFLPQIYVVERKVKQTRLAVEFELSAAMDQAGRLLPKRQILRDACTHIYRRWDGSAFDYDNATCPWSGSDESPGGTETPYFTREDVATDFPELDDCGKRLNSCKVRHNHTSLAAPLPLPTRAFPAVARIRQRR